MTFGPETFSVAAFEALAIRCASNFGSAPRAPDSLEKPLLASPRNITIPVRPSIAGRSFRCTGGRFVWFRLLLHATMKNFSAACSHEPEVYRPDGGKEIVQVHTAKEGPLQMALFLWADPCKLSRMPRLPAAACVRLMLGCPHTSLQTYSKR